MRVSHALVLLLGLALAGCTDPSSSPAGAAGASATLATNVSAGTGSIAGTVTDDQLQPIQGAEVAIKETGASTTTDAAGQFRLANLEPGVYTMIVAKVGFRPFTRSVTVIGGEEATENVPLVPTEILVPRNELFIDDGYIHFVLFYFGQYYVNTVDFVLGTSKTSFSHDAAPGAVSAVGTVSWTPSSSFSAHWMDVWVTGPNNARAWNEGRDPVTAHLGNLSIAATTPIQFGFFPTSPCSETTPQGCTEDPPYAVVNVVYEQRVKLYNTIFYVEGPQDGYTGLPPAAA